MLRNCGVPEERVEAFQTACGQSFGEGALTPANLIDAKQMCIRDSGYTVPAVLCFSVIMAACAATGNLIWATPVSYTHLIAPEDLQSAGGGVGILDGPDGVVIEVLDPLNVLTHGLAGDGQAVQIQKTALGQLRLDSRDAAGRVQVRHCLLYTSRCV